MSPIKKPPPQYAVASSFGHQAPSARELISLLERRGSFPDHLRVTAWRTLLELPGNVEAHASLAARGDHPAFIGFEQSWPLRSHASNRLLRTLSALAYWEPRLAQLPYLPALVFPAVQVFGADSLLTFEFFATFFFNWGKAWLDYFPSPPIEELSSVAILLEHADQELFQHLTAGCSEFGGVPVGESSSVRVLWPLLQTVLSEVLSTSTWLAVWDFLVARWREPDLLGACAVVILRHQRARLLAVPPGNVDAVLRQPASIPSAQTLIKHADALAQLRRAIISPPDDEKPRQLNVSADHVLCQSAHRFPRPLQRGLSYPPLNFTRYSVDFQSLQRAELNSKMRAPTPKRVSSRLLEIQGKLKEAENFLETQHASLQREQKDSHAWAAAESDRMEINRRRVHTGLSKELHDHIERLKENIDASCQSVVRSAMDHEDQLAKELDLQRRRRNTRVTQALDEEDGLQVAEDMVLHLLEKLKERRDFALADHIQHLARLKEQEHETLGELWEEQLELDSMCTQANLKAKQAHVTTSRRRTALAHLQRTKETDLEMKRLMQELNFNRSAKQEAFNRATMHADCMADSSKQLHVKHNYLVGDVDAREQEECFANQLSAEIGMNLKHVPMQHNNAGQCSRGRREKAVLVRNKDWLGKTIRERISADVGVHIVDS